MRQALLLVSIFAAAFAVWMYRRHEAGRDEAMFRAVTHVSREARERNAALEAAVRAQDRETIGQLLRAGANPNGSMADGSPLKIAINQGDVDCVKLLIAAGASVKGASHASPIVVAFYAPIEPSQRVMIWRELLEHDADVKHNQLAMDICYGSGSREIMALLRQQGAAYSPREMALADDIDGLRAAVATDPGLLSRPLASYCMSSKTLLGVALRLGHEDLAGWMLDQGAPLDVDEVSKGSALHLAAVGDCAGTIGRLCQLGCDPNAGDDSGLTPLDYGIATASPQTIKALVDSGADVNATLPGLGKSVLHRAVERYDGKDEAKPSNRLALEIIALLLQAGANPDIADAEGQTARDWACRRCPEAFDRLFGG